MIWRFDNAVIGINLRKLSRFAELFHRATELVYAHRYRFLTTLILLAPSESLWKLEKRVADIFGFTELLIF